MKGASAAMIRNELNQILIVKPAYRADWLLPGGAIEEGESPLEACKRECQEELGVDIQLGNLLCIEYRRAKSDAEETVRFVFDGGNLRGVETITLPPEELEAYKFVEIEEAISSVDKATGNRLRFIQSKLGVYFES